jgi:hypothetical protein
MPLKFSTAIPVIMPILQRSNRITGQTIPEPGRRLRFPSASSRKQAR